MIHFTQKYNYTHKAFNYAKSPLKLKTYLNFTPEVTEKTKKITFKLKFEHKKILKTYDFSSGKVSVMKLRIYYESIVVQILLYDFQFSGVYRYIMRHVRVR